MVQVVEGQKPRRVECPQCLSTLEYVFTETQIYKGHTYVRRGCQMVRAFYAYRYILCPVCTHKIELRKGE